MICFHRFVRLAGIAALTDRGSSSVYLVEAVGLDPARSWGLYLSRSLTLNIPLVLFSSR